MMMTCASRSRGSSVRWATRCACLHRRRSSTAEIVVADCLILDVRLPGLSGLDLRERLRSRVSPIPVVLITGDSDRPTRDISPAIDTPSVTKPFDDVTLMAAIASAIASVER